MKYIYILIIFITGCTNPERYSSVQIESNVDTTLARIGDIINFDVLTHFVDDNIIQFPDLPSTESMEIRRKNVYVKNNVPTNVRFEIVFWDTGSFHIPEYEVNFLKVDSTLDFSIKTDSIKITVLSMVAGAEEKILRPLKDPIAINEPIDWRFVLLIVLLVILILILIGLWRTRIKKPNLEKISVTEYQSAKDIALLRLNELEEMIKIDSKTYYLHLSFLLREFLENQYYLRALEMTTNEIIAFQDEIDIYRKDFNGILNVLNRADLAKFAKHKYSGNEHQADFDWLSKFINSI
jgi:hypothetical protein